MSSTEIKTLVIFEFSQDLTSRGKLYLYLSLCRTQICGYMLPMTKTTTNLTLQSYIDNEYGL